MFLRIRGLRRICEHFPNDPSEHLTRGHPATAGGSRESLDLPSWQKEGEFDEFGISSEVRFFHSLRHS